MSQTISALGKGLRVDIHNGAETVVSFWSIDNQNLQKYAHIPDKDPQKNSMSIEVPDVYLPKGTYTISWSAHQQHDFTPTPSQRQLLVQVPREATGVEAWQGSTGYAWAPAYNGFAQLSLGTGSWEIHAQGTSKAHRGICHASQQAITLEQAPEPLSRTTGHVDNLLLLPGWFSFFALLLCFFRPRWSWLWGMLCGCILTPFFMGNALFDLQHTMLHAAPSITDPIDSLALVSAIDPFSTQITQFQYPEGNSWLRLGPSWIGYLPAIFLTHIIPPVLAHNMGLILSCFLCAGSLFALARSFRCTPFQSALYTICAGLSPLLIEEVDSLSLDRATIWIVPLVFYTIQQSLIKPSRKHIWMAGIALGVSVHLQIYYALYFALGLPLFILSHSLHKRSWIPIYTLLRIAPIALLLGGSALVVLKLGAAGSYDIDSLSIPSLSSIAPNTYQRFLQSPDNSLPTSTGLQRLLSASKASLRPSQAMGAYGFWLLPMAAAFFGNPRLRPMVLLCLLFAVFSLGPIWFHSDWSTSMLPYYAVMKWIPGFDQLKNVYRFGLLCIILLPLPLFCWLRTPSSLICALLYLLTVSIPTQYTLKIPPSGALHTITEGTACMLPLGNKSPNWMILASAQYQISIINPSSLEQGKDTLTPIYLDHPLLNRLALLSAHSELDVLHLATIDKDDILALEKQDIRWFVLPKGELFLQQEIERFLNTHLLRWKEDERFIIWTLPPSL